MTFLWAHILLGLQTLALPVNLAALLGGLIAGGLLGPLLGRIGVGAAAALVLLMPLAITLDPVTGLMLLGACLASALIATAHRAPETMLPPRHHNVPLLAASAGALVILASTATATVLQAATPADTLALLICGAAAAIVLAAATHQAGWTAAIVLTVAGIAAQLSPLKPLDTEQASPVPLLFGLLMLGPAVMALALPRLIVPWTTSFGGIELVVTLLPALLLGVPATRGVSVFALSLGETGLTLGPRLIAQRPKLVAGFIVAIVAAGLVVASARFFAHKLPALPWRPRVSRPTGTRGAAVLVLGAGAVALYFAGVEASQATRLGIGCGLGALAAGFGFELAPLVTGLVIGQLMQAPLQAALQAADGHPIAALTSGSSTLLALSVIIVTATLAWPLLQRPVRVLTDKV